MSTEEWRVVPRLGDLYEVSDLGRLRSWKNARWGRRRAPRLLTLVPNRPDGYLRTSLNGRTEIISGLVLEAFIGPRVAGMEACHNDGNLANNTLSNLRWDTHPGNEADKTLHGTQNIGNRNGMASLNEAKVRRIRLQYAQGMTQDSLAEIYGVSQTAISKIVRRQRWSHVE